MSKPQEVFLVDPQDDTVPRKNYEALAAEYVEDLKEQARLARENERLKQRLAEERERRHRAEREREMLIEKVTR